MAANNVLLTPCTSALTPHAWKSCVLDRAANSVQTVFRSWGGRCLSGRAIRLSRDLRNRHELAVKHFLPIEHSSVHKYLSTVSVASPPVPRQAGSDLPYGLHSHEKASGQRQVNGLLRNV